MTLWEVCLTGIAVSVVVLSIVIAFRDPFHRNICADGSRIVDGERHSRGCDCMGCCRVLDKERRP